MWLFIGLYFFYLYYLFEIFHWYFSVSWRLSSLLVIVIIKIVSLYNSSVSTCFYFINVRDQLNSKNLELQCSFELSVYILGSHKCNFVVGFPILDIQYLILFGIILLLKRNNMTNASISSARLFLFFVSTNALSLSLSLSLSFSLKSWIKQPKPYLKNKKIEIRFIRSFYFMLCL